jgi:hypothetical protein
MWGPQHLAILCAYTACFRDSFISNLNKTNALSHSSVNILTALQAEWSVNPAQSFSSPLDQHQLWGLSSLLSIGYKSSISWGTHFRLASRLTTDRAIQPPPPRFHRDCYLLQSVTQVTWTVTHMPLAVCHTSYVDSNAHACCSLSHKLCGQ